MRKVTLFTLAFLLVGGGAFAVNTDTHFTGPSYGSGEAYDLGLKDILVDNLVTSAGQFTNGYSASTIGGGYDRWVALDYIPEEGSDWNVEDLHMHAIWQGGVSTAGDMNVEFFVGDEPGDDTVTAFTVDFDDLDISDSGMTAFGYVVYNVEFEFECVELTGGETYWIAVQQVCSANVFFMVRLDSIVDDYCWWHDSGVWYDAPSYFGEYSELSYIITGYEISTAVAPSSVGEIKSLFN